jgi:hypothetical protein
VDFSKRFYKINWECPMNIKNIGVCLSWLSEYASACTLASDFKFDEEHKKILGDAVEELATLSSKTVDVYANTTTSKPTHFPAALSLIQNAREKFHIASENWPNPTGITFGVPRDMYYAEVWVDGMDWQTSYWLIEDANYNKPVCVPLFVFDEHRDRLVEYYFNNLCKAVMWMRRDALWIKQDLKGTYRDEVWPYFKKVEGKEDDGVLTRMSYSHASQPKVEFWVNRELLSEL